MAANDDFVRELSKRFGASVEQSDIDTLNAKNPEDLEAHKRALEEQYAKRGAPTSHRQQDSQSGAYPDVGADPRTEVAAAASNQSPAQSWNAQPAIAAPAAPATPQDAFPSWYRDLMTQQVQQQQTQAAETKQRADALYSSLDARANQGLQVNANDPIIRGQVDAYAATGEKSRRNYLSDVAESAGPYANLRGEQRMTAEKLGQGVGGFQAELLGRELGSRRAEIAQALSAQGGMLAGDQQRGLQEKLSAMDQAIREAGVGTANRGLDLQGALGFGGLNLQRELGQGGLALQRDLGFGGLGLQRRGQDIGADQFLRELALREWQLGDESDRGWAGL